MPDQNSTSHSLGVAPPLKVAGWTGQPQPSAGAAGPEALGFTYPETTKTLHAENRRLSRMKRGVITSANLHQQALQDGGNRYRAVMVTLTYAAVDGWQPNHISEYIQRVRRWHERRGITPRYVAVLELQQRGAPHYHVIFFLRRGYTLPLADKQGWWTHGRSNQRWCRRPVGYVAKYASKSKTCAASMPKGARLFIVGGLRGHEREHLRWWMAPAWLRSFTSLGDVIRRAGCWWLNHTTGIGYRSPWVLDNFAGGTPNFLFLPWTEDDVIFRQGGVFNLPPSPMEKRCV